MKVRGLQQQLAMTDYLLPTQRELLSRLLFQLAFNDFSRMAIVGGRGSGKTTLALALAELFSESEEVNVNVAMLQAPIATELLASQLGKQWFSDASLSEQGLSQHLKQGRADIQFVLIADDPEQLTASQYQWLVSLPVKLFLFTQQPDEQMQLNLTIPALTLSDCQQFLAADELDALTLAERFANCQNNLYQLMNKTSGARLRRATNEPTKKPLFAAGIGAGFVVLFLLTSWLHSSNNTVDADLTASQVALPEPAALVTNEQATAVNSSVNAVITEVDRQADPVVLSSPATPSVNEEVSAAVMPPVAENATPDVASVLAADEEAMAIAAEQPLPADVLPEENITVQQPETTVPSPLPETAAVLDHTQILSANGRQFVVQLAVLSSELALNRFKRNYPQLAILVYRRSWQGRGQWVIVSGPFATNANAREFVQQLPTTLSSAGPFIKTVSAAQQEIKAWQRLQLADTRQDN